MTQQRDSGKDDESAREVNSAPLSDEPTQDALTAEADSAAVESPAIDDDVSKANKHHLAPWAWGAGIVVVLLLGGLGYAYFQQQQMQQQFEQLNSELNALKQNSIASSQLNQTVAPLQAQFQSVDGRIGELQKRLDNHQTIDGRYIEIDYQLRMALQRLALNRDVHGAVELLKNADQRIAALNDPAFTPVRDAIQSAVAALNNVSAPDVEGLYLQLGAESKALDSLPMTQSLMALTPEHQQADATAEGEAQPSWWRRQLSRVGHEMKDLIVVRYNDQGVNELLMPEQESAIREHLRMAFSEAQQGLLSQSPTVYAQALQKVSDTLHRYFPQNDDRVKGVIDRINALSQQTIRPELPDVTNVLQQWQQVLDRQHAQQGV